MKGRAMKKIVKTTIVALLLFSALSMVVTKFVYDRQFPRVERHDETITAKLRYDDIKDQYQRVIVKFKSEKNMLTGYLYEHEAPQGLVVVVHGLGGGADSYLAQIKYFLDNGWRVFTYDATGSFDSGGKSTKGFPQAIIDLNAALSYIETNDDINTLPLLLFGHSWGGYAVANMPHFDHEIKGIATVSGANSAMDMIAEQGERMMGPFIYTQKPFLWAYQQLLFGRLTALEAVDAINKSTTPYLIIHGSEDAMVNYNRSAIVAHRDEWINPNVHVITIEEPGRNDHDNLFRSKDALAYIEQINAEYRALYESHAQNIPYEINRSFYSKLDRALVNDLDEVLMEEINTFFLKCIEP